MNALELHAPSSRLCIFAGLLQLSHACGDAAVSSGDAGSGAASSSGTGLRAWLLALELMEDEDDEVAFGDESNWRQLVGSIKQCPRAAGVISSKHRCNAVLLVHGH